jgi:hypothetical protein
VILEPSWGEILIGCVTFPAIAAAFKWHGHNGKYVRKDTCEAHKGSITINLEEIKDRLASIEEFLRSPASRGR